MMVTQGCARHSTRSAMPCRDRRTPLRENRRRVTVSLGPEQPNRPTRRMVPHQRPLTPGSPKRTQRPPAPGAAARLLVFRNPFSSNAFQHRPGFPKAPHRFPETNPTPVVRSRAAPFPETNPTPGARPRNEPNARRVFPKRTQCPGRSTSPCPDRGSPKDLNRCETYPPPPLPGPGRPTTGPRAPGRVRDRVRWRGRWRWPWPSWPFPPRRARGGNSPGWTR